MTKEQQANYNAAEQLAKLEYDTTVLTLQKLTAFIADLQAMSSGLKFPAIYQSIARNTLNEITSGLSYRRDMELPQRIAAYEAAQQQQQQQEVATPAA